eukprot:362336-Chlamydomonas_euryale.AAC.2
MHILTDKKLSKMIRRNPEGYGALQREGCCREREGRCRERDAADRGTLQIEGRCRERSWGGGGAWACPKREGWPSIRPPPFLQPPTRPPTALPLASDPPARRPARRLSTAWERSPRQGVCQLPQSARADQRGRRHHARAAVQRRARAQQRRRTRETPGASADV